MQEFLIFSRGINKVLSKKQSKKCTSVLPVFLSSIYLFVYIWGVNLINKKYIYGGLEWINWFSVIFNGEHAM